MPNELRLRGRHCVSVNCWINRQKTGENKRKRLARAKHNKNANDDPS